MSNKESIDLLFGEDIDFAYKVKIKVPTVEQVAYDDKFNTYVKIFTTTTREIFAMSRDVDKLEEQYPTILSMTKDEEMDFVLGKMMGAEYKGSALIMEALSYWTGLELTGDNGFFLMSNGKIIHIGTEWIIDEEEWNRLRDKIKQILSIKTDRDFEPPKPMNSDTKFHAWQSLLKGRIRKAQNSGISIADKIMILSISMETYIPINEIKKMSIFVFNKLFEGLSKKEAYEMNMQMVISGNFDNDKISKKHWKETFNTK